VEKYSNLSRHLCREIPDVSVAWQWLRETTASKRCYKLPVSLLGHFLGAMGFAIVFGGTLVDGLCSGLCGLIVGLMNHFMGNLSVNQFFSTIAASFVMAFSSYAMGATGIPHNTDCVIIGTLMILVPGLIFTNAMRDIIFGDTNSGTNRIVQVLLVAAAIALGTGVGWNLSGALFGVPVNPPPLTHLYEIQNIATFIACVGFSIIFNIHGPGIFICALGGTITWAVYCAVMYLGVDLFTAYFIAAVIAACYSEAMARVRKYPAISYLVVAIFPLIPGAGIYYATNHLVRGDGNAFAQKSLETVGIAGVIAVGILIVSTVVRLLTVWKKKYKKKASD
jgi:uncharacterized membrane protein YjjB (DUF3815 family)